MARIITTIKGFFNAVDAILESVAKMESNITKLRRTIDKHFSVCYEFMKCPIERKTKCDVYLSGSGGRCWDVVTALCKKDGAHNCHACPFKEDMDLKGLYNSKER